MWKQFLIPLIWKQKQAKTRRAEDGISRLCCHCFNYIACSYWSRQQWNLRAGGGTVSISSKKDRNKKYLFNPNICNKKSNRYHITSTEVEHINHAFRGVIFCSAIYTLIIFYEKLFVHVEKNTLTEKDTTVLICYKDDTNKASFFGFLVAAWQCCLFRWYLTVK